MCDCGPGSNAILSIIKDRFLGGVIRSYYFIWALLLGTGILVSLNVPQFLHVPVYVHYMLLGSIFILLSISLLINIKNLHRGCREDCSKKALSLVFIPAFIFFILGLMVPAAECRIETKIQEGNIPKSLKAIRALGRVSSHPEIFYGNVYFDLSLRSSDHESLKCGDTIRMIIESPDYYGIKRDDMLYIKGEIYLSSDGPVLKAAGSSIKPFQDYSLVGRIFNLRQRCTHCIDQALAHYLIRDHAALARALVLGDRRSISGHQYDIFRKSGTAHLMAISGMHISFLAAFLYIMLERTCSRYIIMLFLIILLLAYNFILGPGASVMRATIWVLGTAAANTWNREFRPPYLLCMSFIFLIMSFPDLIRDAGFWLSFAAMSGMVFIYPLLRRILSLLKLPIRILDNRLFSTILISLSIQLVSGPLLLYYFGSLPLISPLSNLFILPFFYVLISILFPAACLSIIWPPAGGAALRLAYFIFKPVCSIARFFSDIRFPSIEIGDLPARYIFIFYFTILVLFSIINTILKQKV